MSKKHVHFHFHKSLNDFLPPANRQKQIRYEFWGSPTVKDAIEALGVPHVEVALILLNEEPVDFSKSLEQAASIAVYPLTKTIPSLTENPLHQIPPEPFFVLDTHLGKLAAYLRMLGFDSLYNNNYNDEEIIRISYTENRIILTRDLGILKQKSVRYGYYIRNTDPKKQLTEIVEKYGLATQIEPFSRCMRCNGKLESVPKEKVSDQLEPQTRSEFHEFFQCRNCKKIYWKGSHYQRMKIMIRDLSDIR